MNRLTLIQFRSLESKFAGELYYDDSTEHQSVIRVYATDASVYQELPVAVALPKTVEDIRLLIKLAIEQKLTIIPRAAGTSLAGQVVGKGLVVDISKYFGQVLEVNQEEKWVRVQPGVIRDDLNKHLAPYGLLFGPETSTASRAMIGGMIGNNSCGLHSITWGAVRDHLIEVKALLSNGEEVVFKNETTASFLEKFRSENKRERGIYAGMWGILTNPVDKELVEKVFPKKTVTRRNSGYALDSLMDTTEEINLCKLIAGSEGTLCFITEAKIGLVDVPPAQVGVVCVHTTSVAEALLANRVAMRYQPKASELVDKYIMDFTRNHAEYSKNRFFLSGDPEALLIVEFWGETVEEVEKQAEVLVNALKEENLGYAYPLLFGSEATQAWDIRKAGLGLIRNLPGDTQPVNLIEDCAVDVDDLPEYIAELEVLLKKKGLHASYYAHAGAGELHVEPMINLKTSQGVAQFREVLADTAALVKKYKGSLSGEHGDGRLRGEFIPFMMGSEVYELFRQVKRIWDPEGIFNAGKIVDTPPMNAFLRYEPDQKAPTITTNFDFSANEGMLRLTEKCSGSGDCRKTELTGGTMCPSFMATRQEKDTTRARANILRQFLTQDEKPFPLKEAYGEKVSDDEVKEILDLCLSCKGCKSECPSSVDIVKLKAEFTQHYYDKHGPSKRSQMIAAFTKEMKLASVAPWAYNMVFKNDSLRRLANKMVGFHPDRTMPLLASTTLKQWFTKRKSSNTSGKKVYFFCDEFTNYNDVEIGKKAILLLEKLGYQIVIPTHEESGRSWLSKGFVKEAKQIAISNVKLLKDVVTAEIPMFGLEPSCILSFRDEYKDLVGEDLKPAAIELAKHCFTFEEFLANELDKGAIDRSVFTKEERLIKLHGHCHQKSLSSLTPSKKILSLPENFKVHLIPSGCCGMAGSFGYEKEHYAISMKIGELVLFPTVRSQPEEVIIAAAGTSCRHQIKDGTARKALHPAEVLFEALVI